MLHEKAVVSECYHKWYNTHRVTIEVNDIDKVY